LFKAISHQPLAISKIDAVYSSSKITQSFSRSTTREIQNKNTGSKGIAEALERSGGNIYEWDSRHGRVEKYNKREAPWEFDPETEQINPPNPDWKWP